MNKKNIWIACLVIAVLVLGAAFGYFISKKVSAVPAVVEDSEYTAVYLDTGDIYYGKMHWLPKPHLTDVWFLQPAANAEAQAGLMPFKNLFWGPSDRMDINPSKIVWTARLKADSQLVAEFEKIEE